MKQYLDVLRLIMDEGDERSDRTGIGTKTLFSVPVRFNMVDGFPAVTTKRLAFGQVVSELLWFLSGSSDVHELQRLGSRIWDGNAHAAFWKPRARFHGDLGRVYGVQWRCWKAPEGPCIDQLDDVIKQIKEDPYDRRLIVSAWNPGELSMMALPPCHMGYQFDVTSNGKLSLAMTQRSCDMFLGVPFNIASYALLLHMVAQVTGLEPGELVIDLRNAHIYMNHLEQVKEQLSRVPHSLPHIWLNPDVRSIDDFTKEDIRLKNYEHDSYISAPMAVGGRQMIISVIVARDENGVIGKGDNELPWPRIKVDMEHFVHVTKGRPESANTVIMGRKTYEALPEQFRPLPNRTTIVLTRKPAYSTLVPDGVYVGHSLESVLTLAVQLANKETTNEAVPIEVVIAGGESVYREVLPRADRQYITEVRGEFEGDKAYPSFEENEWEEVALSREIPPGNNTPGCHMRVLDRVGTRWPKPELKF